MHALVLFALSGPFILQSNFWMNLHHFLRAAGRGMVYRKYWWPAHDARNRAWIGGVQPLLA